LQIFRVRRRLPEILAGLAHQDPRSGKLYNGLEKANRSMNFKES
jgi:hypothetical protein